ncbi:tripartite-type tricarboxylate transporter receptor subunit TctC [Variovorax paradoxus]|uniref:Bug family tripartite tricarboxylate transporter substrate binding protein n=1 Tax=Variovorax paradoxus TaxID=34073 RepID=UPI00278B0B06|nr:tripartite tricarboxylate transporter substrate-binding protein [Variovorax paradoxus]MDP9962882.1 tripartite-type tricarboxylate transporter receptor subunit TctC [Variovorax paradoxus]
MIDARSCGLRRREVLAVAAVLCVAWLPLHAQQPLAGFPQRPVMLLVGAPPGGPSDALARMLAEAMARELEQPVVVENKPGAGGAIAADAVARAAPDGYTLMLSWIGNATNQTLIPRQRFDINRDFTHISQIVAGTNVLVTRAGIATNLTELIAKAAAQPGRLTYASAGNGSSGHLAMEMLKQRAQVSLTHIPYRGGTLALNDLLGGQVDMMFLNQDAVEPYVRSGRLVALATTGSTRNPLLAKVPTVAESGYPGFEATAWAGLSAPRATPEPVVRRLHDAALRAMQGDFRTRQEALGAQVIGSTSAQYAAFVREETRKWAGVIQAAGIKAD